jgi:hypothetical protein
VFQGKAAIAKERKAARLYRGECLVCSSASRNHKRVGRSLYNQMNSSFNRTAGILRGILSLGIAVCLPRVQAVNVLTQHNDLSRTGANTAETILTPANVNAGTFGQLFTDNVDGQVYAQPLYVQNLGIAGGTHNVVFVCTESNSVYALDADAAGVTYWHTNLGAPFASTCMDLVPIIGITGTPVIDLSSGTIYLDTKLAAGPAHKLHALDITTGGEKFGGPVVISADAFDASIQHQRPGLLLLNGVVYLGYGSHCDAGSYHGYVLGYNATNLTQVAAFNTTPTGSEGGVWSGGMAPAADTNGNIYIMVGNGTFDGTANYGECFVKLSANLTVEDYAVPTNWSTLNQNDTDLGSGGPVLLPTHFVAGMGKDGNMYLADVNHMGQVGNFTQVFAAQNLGDTIGASPVYWQGPTKRYVFALHANSPTKSFLYTGTNFFTTALGTASFTQSDRCGGMSLSANGRTNGVLWEVDSDSNLRAYDAANFPTLLWTGSVGTYVKMNCPTIANGKVYVGTSANLTVWGLTDFLYTQKGVTNPALSWATGTLLQATNLSGPWLTNPAGSPYTVQPTNPRQFYRVLQGTGP